MKGRFHYLYALRYLRYGLLLCLVPLVRALFAFQIEAFFTALQQDLLILVVMGFLSAYTWLGARYSLEAGVLRLDIGFLFQRTYCYHAQDIAACELRRSLPLRLLGAAQLEVYLRTRRSCKSQRLLLPYKQALALREALLPVPEQEVEYRPSGGEWLTLVALSTNLVTEGALVLYTVNRVERFLGTDLSGVAFSRLENLALAANTVIPAGLALLLSVFFFFTLCSVAISALRAGGFRVARAGDLLLCRGGLYTRVEQRVRVGCINAIDLRRTPLARLTGCQGIYLYAGGFTNRNTPVLFYSKRSAQRVRQLLPEMLPPAPLPVYARRSPWQYLWVHGAALALWVVFWVLALRLTPDLAPVLGLLCLVWLAFLLVQLEAIFTEGYAPRPDGRCCVGYSRRLTRHFVTVFLPGCGYSVSHTSLSVQEGRATLALYTPAGTRLVVRGVDKAQADRWVRQATASPPSAVLQNGEKGENRPNRIE